MTIQLLNSHIGSQHLHGLLYARNYVPYTSLLTRSSQPYKMSAIIKPVLSMRKLKPREVKPPAQGHPPEVQTRIRGLCTSPQHISSELTEVFPDKGTSLGFHWPPSWEGLAALPRAWPVRISSAAFLLGESLPFLGFSFLL